MENKAKEQKRWAFLKKIKPGRPFVIFFSKWFGLSLLYFAFVQLIYALVYCFNSESVYVENYTRQIMEFTHFDIGYLPLLKGAYLILLLLPFLLIKKTTLKELGTSIKKALKRYCVPYAIYLIALYAISFSFSTGGNFYLVLFNYDIILPHSAGSLFLMIYMYGILESFVSKVFFVLVPFLCFVGWQISESHKTANHESCKQC